MPRRLESDAAVVLYSAQVDGVIFAPDTDADKLEVPPQILDRAKIVFDLLHVRSHQRVGPVVAEGFRRPYGLVGPPRRDLLHPLAQAIVADKRRQQFGDGGLEAAGVIRERRRVAVRPDAIRALIAMHRAERNEVLNAELLRKKSDLPADGAPLRRIGDDPGALFVEAVVHVGVAVAGKL